VGWKSKAGAGALVLALGLVTQWEGYSSKVYLDPVGIPTVCYGHVTNPELKVGTAFSNEACHNLLYADLKVASDGVDRFVKVPLAPYEKAAFTSFVFNAGIGNFRKSDMLEYINQGEIAKACHELPRWVYAKGKKLWGLVNRRQAEMELCLGQ
jgi:lysozyme